MLRAATGPDSNSWSWRRTVPASGGCDRGSVADSPTRAGQAAAEGRRGSCTDARSVVTRSASLPPRQLPPAFPPRGSARAGRGVGAWRWRWSLRVRLAAAATAAVGCALGAAGAILVARETSTLHASLTSAVTRRVERVSDLLALGAPPVTAVAGAGVQGAAIQVLGRAGEVLASSADLTGQGPVFSFPVLRRLTVREIGHLPVGGEAQFMVAGTALSNGDRIYAGLSTGIADQSIAALIRTLLLGLPVLIGLLGLAGWQLIGRALRPVERLRWQAEGITVTDLHRRLDVPAGRDELHGLAVTLNDMLIRLDSSSSAQRQFVADAAHELRSPLAGILAAMEITATRITGGSAGELATELLPEARRLSRLVEDLLRLARMDAGPRLTRGAVDLEELVFAEVRRVRALGVARVQESSVDAARVCGDADALTRVVGNLLDNAVRHANGSVEVSVQRHGRTAELVVADNGAGIDLADRERVFNRFTRLDDSRSRDAGGSGLGLAIVQDVVRTHNGSVFVDERPGGGARFHVHLPLLTTDTVNVTGK